MVSHNLVSASPLCPSISKRLGIKPNGNVLFGYDLIARFCGWAFVWTREFYNRVGFLDERFNFWCSDNACVEQLLAQKEQHGLITSSFVGHHGSLTLESLSPAARKVYTIDEIEKFEKLFGKDLRKSEHLRSLFSPNQRS